MVTGDAAMFFTGLFRRTSSSVRRSFNSAAMWALLSVTDDTLMFSSWSFSFSWWLRACLARTSATSSSSWA